jgi:hypothetical protein
VIVHDETLDRLFGVPRRVRDLSAAELVGLGVPTLTEVLAAMPIVDAVAGLPFSISGNCR